jgi:hypothetical protein
LDATSQRTCQAVGEGQKTHLSVQWELCSLTLRQVIDSTNLSHNYLSHHLEIKRQT